MEPSATSTPERAEVDRLRAESDRVDALLGELSQTINPEAFARVEELVERLVGLYGAGLDRVLAHVTEAGGWSEELASRLDGDGLVSSLLALHGLHPVPAFARLDRAFASLNAELGPRAEIELLGLGGDGTARVRIAPGPGAPARGELEEAVRDVAMTVAPELIHLAFEDGGYSGSGLVQLRVKGTGP